MVDVGYTEERQMISNTGNDNNNDHKTDIIPCAVMSCIVPGDLSCAHKVHIQHIEYTLCNGKSI